MSELIHCFAFSEERRRAFRETFLFFSSSQSKTFFAGLRPCFVDNGYVGVVFGLSDKCREKSICNRDRKTLCMRPRLSLIFAQSWGTWKHCLKRLKPAKNPLKSSQSKLPCLLVEQIATLPVQLEAQFFRRQIESNFFYSASFFTYSVSLASKPFWLLPR